MEGFDELTIEKQREIKISQVRSVRDGLLNNSDWITSRITKEDKAENLKLIEKKDKKWTDEQIVAYLYWTLIMVNIPEVLTANENAALDALEYEDIHTGNIDLFPTCPIDPRLTPLPSDEKNKKSEDITVNPVEGE